MRRIVSIAALVAAVLGVPTTAVADPAVAFLSIGSGVCSGLEPISLDIEMDNILGPVQGFVLAIDYDENELEALSINIDGTETEALGAELVVGQIYPVAGGVTLGVVLDSTAPFEGQVFPVGDDHPIANLVVRAAHPVLSQLTTTVNFLDATFGSPLLNNIVVIDGLSIGVPQGLGLIPGQVICNVSSDKFYIEATCLQGDHPGAVPITMDIGSGFVQGFVLAITHNAADLNLEDINIDGTATELAGAEFVVPDTNPPGGVGGTLGVVLDFEAPFDGQTIAPGSDVHAANYVYSCVNPPEIGDPIPTTNVFFIDDVLGSPPLTNVLVVDGLSIQPGEKHGADICCEPAEEECMVTFWCGGPVLGTPLEGTPGEVVDLCFYYSSTDNIQGFQLAVCFDCDLTLGEFSIEGSIVEAVGAEWVNFNVDNEIDADDPDDGCELLVGILLDALPPFDDQTVPPTTGGDPLLIGCIDATISPDAACDTTLGVEFCDWIDGAGTVLIENIAVIDYQSYQDVCYENCGVYVTPEPTFQRGDCNDDDKVDLADAAAIIGSQFGDFDPACDDACDANDDGKINLADSVFLLNWKFKDGAEPPTPGPVVKGPDPSEDDLGCETSSCD